MKRNLLKIIGLLVSFPAIAQQGDRLAYPDLGGSLWYKNVLIYNLEVGVFKDSDGDGRGDIPGLTGKLDYLRDLGVNVLWLAPFFPSPGQDDGYDVADFYGVDPAAGNHGHFTELVRQARQRGMRIILDLVINHTSDTHPWFRESARSRDSPFRSWYIWAEKRPRDWQKGMVFPGVEEGVWSPEPQTGAYYFHRFYRFQPDLNYENPEVVSEMQRVIGFWLQQGIDGFRVDAVPFVLELSHTKSESPRLDFELLYRLRQFSALRNPEAIILGEANVDPKENQAYFGQDSRGLQMMFNFYVNQHLFFALATGEAGPLRAALKATQSIPEMAQWAHFLRNHDEIDLGRLTEKQRQRVFERFGPDTSMQLYDRGIRRRLAPMLGRPDLIRLAYSLLFALPGTPVIRYGEEIGMGDDLRLKERLSVRTPMQWDATRNAGFSSADSTWRPVISEGKYDYRLVNVAVQQRDSSSLLHHIKRLASLRRVLPEIGQQAYEVLDTGIEGILALRYQGKGGSVLILHNFCDCEKQVRVPEEPGRRPSLLYAKDPQISKGADLSVVTLKPYDFRWYKFQ